MEALKQELKEKIIEKENPTEDYINQTLLK